jgi:primosomal replication protein N
MLAKAEGFVGMDEGTWRNRARYARRAMAQTRAMSRAARSAFAHVVVLIDSGLSTTPYEEIPHEDEPAGVPAKSNTKPAVPLGSPDDVADVKDMLKLIVLPDGMVDKWFKSAGVTRWEDMPADKLKKCIQVPRKTASPQQRPSNQRRHAAEMGSDMPSVNKVIIIGHLTRDPQSKQLPSQTTVTEFGIAMNRKFKGAGGEEREEVCFVDCAAFGRAAEVIQKYCTKGKALYVEGRLKLDSWEDKQGGESGRS